MFSKCDSELSRKSSNTELNSASKCRGCLKEELDMNSLFVKFEKSTTLAKVIEEFIGYVVSEEEQFSEYLCKECTKVIVDFIRFKTTFHEATEYFKNLKSIQVFIENTEKLNVKEFNNDGKGDYTFSEGNVELLREAEFNVKKCDNLDKLPELTKNHQILRSGSITKETKNIHCDITKHFRPKFQIRRHKRTICQKNTRKKNHLDNQLWPNDTLEKTLKGSNVSVIKIGGNSVDPNCKIICKVCKCEFLSEEYECHFETHKIHVCNTCGHKFIRKTDLNDHKETHLDICKYVCQHCGKPFKVRSALNKHKRIHTHPREEICDVCGQRFNTRDTLKTHYKLKHVKSKDFQCSHCGLAFALKSTLEKHIERHNPNRQRIHSCKLCNISYLNKYNLDRHHTIKHTAFENRPTCEFCGKGYVKKLDLVKHVKRHHQRNDEEKKEKGDWKTIKPEND